MLRRKGVGRAAKVGATEGRRLGGFERALLRPEAGVERGIRREGENAPTPLPTPHALQPAHPRNRMRTGDLVDRAFVGRAGGLKGSAHAHAAQPRGVCREKGRGGRSCCAGSSRRGRGCGVPGAEERRHWSPREGKDPARDRTWSGRVDPCTLRHSSRDNAPHPPATLPPPPLPELSRAQALKTRTRTTLDPWFR